MRIVVKVGTGTLSEGGQRLSRRSLLELVRQVCQLHQQQHEVILVSSGAVFCGRQSVATLPHRKDIEFKQSLAAVGQVRLMAVYDQLFSIYDVTIAQALLTRGDLMDRERYLNARNTMLSLLALRIVPIINENDVVAVEEIRIGDNDNLSALVSNLVDADLLAILTDQAGLYTADPRLDPDARLIPVVKEITDEIRQLARGSGTQIGTGGMATKIQAAEMATRSGTQVAIVSGAEPDVLIRLVNGESIGTRFLPTVTRMESRKRWILAEPPQGEITVDAGAARALKQHGKSLLAVGVVDVKGSFERGQTVKLVDGSAREIARGIVHYNARDLLAIRGHHSEEIASILGYEYGPTVVHRDDMVVVC